MEEQNKKTRTANKKLYRAYIYIPFRVWYIYPDIPKRAAHSPSRLYIHIATAAAGGNRFVKAVQCRATAALRARDLPHTASLYILPLFSLSLLSSRIHSRAWVYIRLLRVPLFLHVYMCELQYGAYIFIYLDDAAVCHVISQSSECSAESVDFYRIFSLHFTGAAPLGFG